MDLRSLANKAKQIVDKRGGVGSLKEDAEELKDIAGGGGSVTDKAKAAAEAVKDPGAPGQEPGPGEPQPHERQGERLGGAGQPHHHREHGEHRERPGR
jgi:hypothetical protein